MPHLLGQANFVSSRWLRTETAVFECLRRVSEGKFRVFEDKMHDRFSVAYRHWMF